MSKHKSADPFGAILDQHERMARATTHATPAPAPATVVESEPLRFGDIGGTARGIWRSACRDCGDPLCQGECLPEGQTWPCKHCKKEPVTIPGTACLPCVATLHRDSDGRIVYGAVGGRLS